MFLLMFVLKAEIDTLLENINLGKYYTRTEIYDIDNELSTLILNTYTNTGTETNYFYKNQISANVTSNH